MMYPAIFIQIFDPAISISQFRRAYVAISFIVRVIILSRLISMFRRNSRMRGLLIRNTTNILAYRISILSA